jgi:pyruvate/2-oxoacid:ferredoxin oxidoreductase beta subunit/pyruvate/2-oxoacid:ferredoxin oxidoreductase alpha subunit
VKLLESEHAVADYLAGVAGSCRGIITGTATSSVGLDHMAESVRSLGASGLGNIVLVDVCRATANYPLCIEGDPSDMLAHRDSGFIQVMCRGRQQIYDTLLQLPAVGMDPSVLTPVMPSYFGIKDSHRTGRFVVEPDDEVNAFLDEQLLESSGGPAPLSEDFLAAQSTTPETPPGLLDGDTSMGSCVTSAWFQAFKIAQKQRQLRALRVIPRVAAAFARRFGRPGIELVERHAMDGAEIALVCLGPDAGTAIHLVDRLRAELRVNVGVVVVRLMTPFPAAALADALAGVSAVAVVNQAHHHGRGHLTLDVVEALSRHGAPPPIDSFFCGLGGADVSAESWHAIARHTAETAHRGRGGGPGRAIPVGGGGGAGRRVMGKPLPLFKDLAMREDAFGEGHSLCPGCEEAVTFHTIGRATDNGKKTVMVLGTSCGEVSTLMYPSTIAWGRGDEEPASLEKSLGIVHHVFESAPTVAEGVRDTATLLGELGAWRSPPPNVISWSGDGGALAIGLRALLHTIHRRTRVAIFVNVNEIFANTGFQYSPTSLPWADSATLPFGGPAEPIDHIGLTIAAGAGFVAQASPGFAPFFAEVVDEALRCETTAVVFVPSPCIAGWKFEEGLTAELGRLAAKTGLFPCFRKRAGAPVEIKHLAEPRPRVEEWLARQRRFEHLVRLDGDRPVVVAGRESSVAAIQSYADRNVARLRSLATSS